MAVAVKPLRDNAIAASLTPNVTIQHKWMTTDLLTYETVRCVQATRQEQMDTHPLCPQVLVWPLRYINSPTTSTRRTMGYRLLLSAHDSDITQLLTRALTREGYTVDIHTTPGAAQRAIRTKPDIVVLDGSSDPGGGPSACWRLRDAGATAPVLLLTNRTASIDHAVAQESGANDCLVKPFRLAELLTRLHALLPQTVITPGA